MDFALPYQNIGFAHHGPPHQPHINHHEYIPYNENPTNQFYELQHHPHHGLIMGDQNAAMGSHDKTETKPRLAKNEVDQLEAEFQRNNKPNSNLKRELAAQMRVDITRINNWFQNRRAKAKHEKKAAECEAEKEASRKESEGADFSYDPFTDDQTGSSSPSNMSMSSSTAMRSSASIHPHYDDPAAASINSYERALRCAAEAQGQFATVGQDIMQQPHYTTANTSGIALPASTYSGSESLDSFDMNQIDLMHSHDFLNQPVLHMNGQQGSLGMFDGFHNDHDFTDHHNTIPYGADMHSAQTSVSENMDDDFNDQSESDESNFKQPPPPAEIAARRRVPKPMNLTQACFRSNSFGPNTVTGPVSPSMLRSPGIPTQNMRRVSSFGGLNNVMNGRIQKSGTVSAQRSPRSFQQGPVEFGGLKSSWNGRKQSVVSQNSSAAPLTPLTPAGVIPNREDSASTTSELDITTNFMNNGFSTNLPNQAMAAFLGTPPETPGFSNSIPMVSQLGWTYPVDDDPIHTPAQATFPREFQMTSQPMPQYLSCLANSQPGTPAIETMGPNTTFGQYFNPLNNTSSALEYTFPNSMPTYQGMKSIHDSPDRLQKQYVFANSTPAAFVKK